MPTLEIADLKKFGGAWGLLWCDLETTGTNEEVDEIIEIGAVVTDFELRQIGDSFTKVIQPTPAALGRLMYEDAVREMHLANGLLHDIVDQKGTALWKAEEAMIKWLQGVVNRGRTRGPVNKFRFMLAGSGVGHFDKRFIKEWMPQVDQLLTFPLLDVGMVRRFLRVAGVEPSHQPNDSKDHRALADVRLHLEEARMYRDWFQADLKPMVSVEPLTEK